MTPESVSPSREDKAPADRWRLWGALLSAVLSPLSLALVNDDWLFTPVGYLDPFQYVGLFMNFDRPDFLAGHYKLARLPWVISGYLAYHALPPTSASIVLHLVYLAVAVGATFLAIWIPFRDLGIAFLVSVALGFFTPFHGSGGWDYHNAAAGSYYLVTVALVHGAIWFPQRRRLCLLGAGAVLALTLHSNITFINLVPALFVYLGVLVMIREGTGSARRSLIWAGMWLAAGAVLSTAVLCVVSLLAGRDPLFFWPLVAIVLRYVTDTQTQASWWKPWYSLWFLYAEYLVIPAAVCIASIAALVMHPQERSEVDETEERCRQVSAVLMLGQFLVACALWILWQTLGQTALVPEYYAYPIYPLCFLAIAAILYRHGRQLRASDALVGGAIVVGAFWMLLTMQGDVAVWFAWPEPLRYPVLPSLVVAVGAFVMLLAFKGGRAGILVWGLLLAVANSSVLAAANTSVWPVSPQLAVHYGWWDSCRIRRDLFNVVVKSSRLIWEVDPNFERARVWFPEHASFRVGSGCTVNVTDLAYSITEAATGWKFLTQPWPMPDVDELPDSVIQNTSQEGDLIVLITRNVEDVERLRRRSLRLGLSLELIRQAHVSSGLVGVDLYVVSVSGKQRVPRRWGWRLTLQELSGHALRNSWNVNVYGPILKGGLVDAPDGGAFFESRTRLDHVALPFVDLPLGNDRVRATGRRWAMIEASGEDVQDQDLGCRIVLQTETFARLGGMPCPRAPHSASESFVMIPVETKKVRVYIENPRARFRSELPQSVRLSVMMEVAEEVME